MEEKERTLHHRRAGTHGGEETSGLRKQLTNSSEVLRTSRVRDWMRE